MPERPELTMGLNAERFLLHYYLKEELIGFCRTAGIQTGGGKREITERIAHFLRTGERMVGSTPAQKSRVPRPAVSDAIAEDTRIEEGFVCTQAHRAFFKEKIGKGFSFNVAFQNWLKANAGKTYADAVDAYEAILEAKKTEKTAIAPQFEYNTYIRAFFAENAGKGLADAIACWKYKKSIPGHNRYEPEDLKALEG